MTLPVGEVLCGDCLDVMRGWPDGCVDAVITDPPYGMSAGSLNALRGRASNLAANRDYGNFAWDSERPSVAHFTEMLRVGREQAIFGGNFFADLLPPSRCWYCWDRERRNDFADCELIWTSLDAPARMIAFHYNGCMMADRRDNERQHPTQKPVQVMERLITDLTQPGDLVLDPFCGSGTTLTACERLGRQFIGIELNPQYAEMARKRTAQKGLFSTAHSGASTDGAYT